MPPPLLKLANELLDMILEELPDTNDLSAVSLTCKNLYSLVLPFLYRRYINVGERQPGGSFSMKCSLWPFLRTLLHRPELGLLVKEVQFGGSKVAKADITYGTRQLMKDDWEIFQQSLKANNISASTVLMNFINSQGVETLTYDFETFPGVPLLPILFHTPNVKILKLHGRFPGMDRLLCKGGHKYKPPTSRMLDLHTYAEQEASNLSEWSLMRDIESLMILPHLRTATLALGCIDRSIMMNSMFSDLDRRSSSVQDLTLLVRDDEKLSLQSLHATGERLIRSCQNLKRFCYSNPRVVFLFTSPSAKPKLVQGFVNLHQDSLTTIVIDRLVVGKADFSGDLTLTHFTRLQHVIMPMAYLTPTHTIGHSELALDIQSRLPPQILALTLIMSEGLGTVKNWSHFLSNVVPNTTKSFVGLRSFSIEFRYDFYDVNDFHDWEPFQHMHFTSGSDMKNYFVRVVDYCSVAPVCFNVGWDYRRHKRTIFKCLRHASGSGSYNGTAWLSLSPKKEWYYNIDGVVDPDDRSSDPTLSSDEEDEEEGAEGIDDQEDDEQD